MNLEKRIAQAMLKIVKPTFASGDDFTSIDIDDTDIDFEELARVAIEEITKTSEPCGVWGCAVYPALPTATRT